MILTAQHGLYTIEQQAYYLQKSPVEKIMFPVKRGLRSGGSLCITICRSVGTPRAHEYYFYVYMQILQSLSL